jgi:hypothetical protein
MRVIKTLFVEDDPQYRKDGLSRFRNLASADASFLLSIDACGSVQEAVAYLRDGIDYDLILTDLDLGPGRGTEVLHEAMSCAPRAARALYSGAAKADFDDFSIQVWQHLWRRDRLDEQLRTWCSRFARACTLSRDGTCLAASRTSLALPTGRYCYVSIPHDERFALRSAILGELVQNLCQMPALVTAIACDNDALGNIHDGILHCFAYMADLAGLRSNVLLEAGMASAWQKRMLLLTPGTPVDRPLPFNLSTRTAHWYGDDLSSAGVRGAVARWALAIGAIKAQR